MTGRGGARGTFAAGGAHAVRRHGPRVSPGTPSAGPDGGEIVLRSTTWQGGGLAIAGDRATLAGTGVVTVLDHRGRVVRVIEDARFRVDAVDAGGRRTPDGYALIVYTPDGRMLPQRRDRGRPRSRWAVAGSSYSRRVSSPAARYSRRRSEAQRVSSWREESWSLRSTLGHVGLDGLDRDEQLLGDLLVGVAAGDQPHHLALALGEPVEVLVDGGDLDRAGEGVEDEAGQPRARTPRRRRRPGGSRRPARAR